MKIMNEFIHYLLQSASILAVMYSVYWIFLRKDTFFHVNRFYLIATVLCSILVPMFNFSFMAGKPDSTLMVLLEPVLITPEKVENATSSHLSWFGIAGIIYLTGVFIFTLRFLVQLIQLLALVKRNKITHQDGANLVFVDSGYSPFSFFNLIFIRQEFYIDGKLTPVIEHEKIHIHQYHTLDLILIEIAVILQWFNPFAWFLGRSVKSVHEFLADEGVLKLGFRRSDYQSLILNEAMGLQINNLTNNFNVSLLKNRIKMMTKTRSDSWSLVKVGFALPAILAIVFFFPAGSAKLPAQDNPQQSTLKESRTVSQAGEDSNDKVFEVVETMPSYPGGMDAMIQYLVANIKYPEEAKKNKITGTVFVTFIVEKDGSINKVKILQGIGAGCDEEAMRVVAGMPKWSPGLDKGKPVRVMFNLPIKFSLDDKPKK
jgi:TonB family protein